jgi:hypothetical protein
MSCALEPVRHGFRKARRGAFSRRLIREIEGALDMKSITLRFHSITNADGEHEIVAEPIDNRTGDKVASYSLSMTAAWLKRHGYGWRVASLGI